MLILNKCKAKSNSDLQHSVYFFGNNYYDQVEITFTLRESEKPSALPLLASNAPELLLLTLLSPWCPAQVFFAGSTGLPPDPQGRGRRVNHVQIPTQLVTTGQGYLLAGPHSVMRKIAMVTLPSMLLLWMGAHLVMRKIEMVTTPPCCCFGWVPT